MPRDGSRAQKGPEPTSQLRRKRPHTTAATACPGPSCAVLSRSLSVGLFRRCGGVRGERGEFGYISMTGCKAGVGLRVGDDEYGWLGGILVRGFDGVLVVGLFDDFGGYVLLCHIHSLHFG